MKHFLIILCTLACSLGVNAQNQNAQGLNMQNQQVQDQKVLTGTLWDNWFIQAGLDMSLQNTYGCDFSEVFPKGKTFGVGKMVYAACGSARKGELGERTLYLQEQAPGMGGTG